MKIARIAGLLAALLSLHAGLVRADPVYATTSGGQLISFDSSSPGALSSSVSLSGVAGSLVGIDFRPAAPDTLYGLGNNGGVGTIYSINRVTGVAAPVYTLTTALAGTSFGVDFNPVQTRCAFSATPARTFASQASQPAPSLPMWMAL